MALSVAVSLAAAGALGWSLTPTGKTALRHLAAEAANRNLPWAPVVALADTNCGFPSTFPGTTPPPTTSGGGTPPPTTSGGGTPPPTTSGGGTPPPTTSGGGSNPPPSTGGGTTCPQLTVALLVTNTTICTGGTTSLTAVTGGGVLPLTYSWSPATGLSSTTAATVTASPTTSTTYMVTVTDASSATASASFPITVSAPPTVSISGAPTSAILAGSPINLTATAGGGSGFASFSWTKNGAAFGAGSTINDSPAVGDTTYAVTANDANGCTANASAIVRVFDYSIVLSPSDVTVLAGTTATFNVSLSLVPGSDTTGAPSSVALTISGAPAGASISSPAMLSRGGTGGTGTVSITTATPSLGDFSVVASAMANGETQARTASAGLHVYDFTVVVMPTHQTAVTGGGSASYTVTTALAPGSTMIGLPPSVSLSVIGLPSSVTPGLAPTVGFGASVPLTIAVGPAAAGDYPFTVVGSVPGGSRSATADLFVTYNICVQYDQTQVKKAGSTIPIKLQLCDANGGNVSAPDVVVHAVYLQFLAGTVPPVTPDDSGNANPDNDFRFDSTGAYIYNLSTKGLAPGAWTLGFTAGADPTPHQVGFILK